MKRLLLALVSVLVASAAHAAPVRYGFFQGGFGGGGFVAGFFVAEDVNRDGFISYTTQDGQPFCGPNVGPRCELLAYHNSLGHHGLSSFGDLRLSDSTSNSWGVHFRIGSSTLPVGNWLPEGCNIFDEANPCTSSPDPGGFIASHGPDIGDSFSVSVYHGGLFGNPWHDNWCADFEPQCGEIGTWSCFFCDTTIERVRIFAVAEPHPLTLIGIALVCLAFIRRRAMRIA